MASNRYGNTSPEPLKRQGSRSHGVYRQESSDNQQARAIEESSRILQDITGNPKGYQLSSGSGWSKTKRIPRRYYINDNQTILIIFQGDITKTKVDAIVNAANEHMTGGSGVDGIIHDAAGNDLYRACKAHKQVQSGVRLPTGHSRILLSYNMSPTTYYIINTAGPVYRSNKKEECAKLLSSCYETALSLANLYDLESIGFTAISCGIFGYPADDGAEVALRTVNEKAGSLPVVVFVLWDNHIYDAWLEKAEELKFTPYDPESSTIGNPFKPSIDDDQEKITRNPAVNDDQPESPVKSTTHVIDLSTRDETEKTPEIESLIDRLPSVPHESSDTQRTEDMDQDDNPTDSTGKLITQNTVEMTNVNSQKDGSSANDSLQQGISKSEDEKAKSDTIQDESHRFTSANNHEEADDKKTE